MGSSLDWIRSHTRRKHLFPKRTRTTFFLEISTIYCPPKGEINNWNDGKKKNHTGYLIVQKLFELKLTHVHKEKRTRTERGSYPRLSVAINQHARELSINMRESFQQIAKFFSVRINGLQKKNNVIMLVFLRVLNGSVLQHELRKKYDVSTVDVNS